MELFKLFGTIAVDNSSANRGIDETTNKAEQSSPKISAAFAKVGSAAIAVGKTVATGLAAGAAAVGVLAKSAMGSYADYEQLVGGVETLFGAKGAKTVEEYAAIVGQSVEYVSAEFEMLQNAQSKVMENASQAYQSAGMSANEYMETIAGFAASLKQSTASELEAAEIGDMAVRDMADNANKMGTTMSAIQNAYQGFAKQNYTMLDNLKLGYGGTKTEMERLLKDAKALSGIEYDIDSLADVYEAIHVIQEEMGITGTTAEEASETISGSLASTKAAWKNLLTGFADGNQDLSLLMANLVTSATTAAHNIVPRIAQILGGISEALPIVIGTISEELPGLMEELLPGLISGAVALVVGLAEMIPSLVDTLFVDLPYYLSTALYESTNPVVSQLGSLFLGIGEALAPVGEAFGSLATAVLPILEVFPSLSGEFDFLSWICGQVKDGLGKVADKVNEVAEWISEHSGEIKTAIETLWNDVQFVWESIGQPIWDAVKGCVEAVWGAFEQKMPEILEFVQNCFDDISVYWEEHLKPCLTAIGDFLDNTLAPAFQECFEVTAVEAVNNSFEAIKKLWENSFMPMLTGITDFLTGTFTADWRTAWDGLVEISYGVANLIILGIEFLINECIDGINDLIEGINKLSSAIGIPDIPLLPNVELPKLGDEVPQLAKGGVLEKGQIGILEGNGAEAVVPLDQNKKWISAVADDMGDAIGGNGSAKEIQELREVVQSLVDDLPGMMVDAFASMKFEINNREFARLTAKAVN